MNDNVKKMFDDIIGWAELSFCIGGIAFHKQRDLQMRIECGIGRASGVEHPVQHLRLFPHEHCGNWEDGDKVFLVGKTYIENEEGMNFNKCPICFPKK